MNDLTLPNDLEAEKGVLSAMLTEPEALEYAIESLLPDDFHSVTYRRLFKLIASIHATGTEIDFHVIKAAATQQGLAVAIGGDKGFLELMEYSPLAGRISNYIHTLRELDVKRSVIRTYTQTLENIGTWTAAEIINRAELNVQDLNNRTLTGETSPIGVLLEKTMHEIEVARETNTYTTNAVPTGFTELDSKLAGGFRPGELILLAARPSVGKTTLALNIMRRMAGKGFPGDTAYPVMLFSLEMPSQDIANHILCAEAKVHGKILRTRGLNATEGDIAAIQAAKARIDNAPIFLDDAAALGIGQLRSKARRKLRNAGIKAIFVDYLQLMETDKSENRNQEITALSRNLKLLAREMSVPLVILSQLRRPAQTRLHERPTISDLRESGSLEQDADVIMLLWRKDYQAHAREDVILPEIPPLEVILGKNRNGETGTIQLTYFQEQYRIENYHPGSVSGGY